MRWEADALAKRVAPERRSTTPGPLPLPGNAYGACRPLRVDASGLEVSVGQRGAHLATLRLKGRLRCRNNGRLRPGMRY